VFPARQFILAIPRDLIEAGRLDGAGHVRIFVYLILPLCKPLLAVLFFMSLRRSWNDFTWPLIALKDNALFTLPIGSSTYRASSAPTMAPP
jgi:multiple sugar transport system permease protein